MAKSPFDLNALEGQEKMMKATKELGAVAMESAQSINQINQASNFSIDSNQ